MVLRAWGWIVVAGFLGCGDGSGGGRDGGVPGDAGPEYDTDAEVALVCQTPCATGLVCVQGACEVQDCVTSVAGGGAHHCAVRKDATVWCWGANSAGQIGRAPRELGDLQATPWIVRAREDGPALAPVAQVAGGDQHTCARMVDGTVYCWGQAFVLGAGETVGSAIPTPLQVLVGPGAPLRGARELAVGGGASCARLDSGEVFCWGANFQDTLGTGNGQLYKFAAPVLTSGGQRLSDVVQLTRSGGHSCVRRGDGSVWCWGGRDGVGDPGPALQVPRPVEKLPAGQAVDVVAGGGFTCARKADATMVCWGQNMDMFGTSTIQSSTTPVAVTLAEPGLVARIDRFHGGPAHLCASAAGELWCWGQNSEGQAGPPPMPQPASTPIRVPLSATVQAGLGSSSTCAVAGDGSLRCWGDGRAGQLGMPWPGTAPRAVTLMDSTPLGRLTAISAGSDHSCALDQDGLTWCWGSNAGQQLGDGTRIDHPHATRASSVLAAITLVSGAGASCVLDRSQQLFCWGLRSSPGGIPLATEVLQVAGGRAGICYAKGTTVTCMSPAGDADTVTTAVAPATLAVGSNHVCMVGQDGSLWCWGQNTDGQLGNGSASPVESPPFQVMPPGSAKAVSAAASHSCALKIDGSAWCWGDNFEGQLGNGGNLDARVPSAVIGGLHFTTIASGIRHTCAIATDRNVHCWGGDDAGQLGDGRSGGSEFRARPYLVTGLGGNIAALATGDYHTCAVLESGTARCWGEFRAGQLGDGVRFRSETPVQVPLTCR